MPIFAVMLRGENFVVDLDGKPTRLGFFTTRYVRAPTPEAAEFAAVARVKKDKQLTYSVQRDTSPLPMLYAERIESRPWWQVLRRGAGYSFWDMDAEDKAPSDSETDTVGRNPNASQGES
jgi:hypothetical protein